MHLIGHKLGHFEIVEKIASGGMADVYKARQENLDRDVALKILPVALSRDPTFQMRFEQEARAAARLHHPNILKIFDYGTQDELTYIVMEYVPGGTLKQRIQGPMPIPDALEIVIQLGDALAYAHHQGVIHRDVKPSNVLIAENGWPLLADFGLAKVTQERKDLTGTGVSIGTPEYMSPEQGQGRPADHRADIYALGVILYEMVTGRVPFSSDTPVGTIVKLITEQPQPPRTLRPDLPVAIEAIILKALAKDPADRFASAAEMVIALQRAAQSRQGTPAQGDTLPDLVIPRQVRPQKARRARTWIGWAAVALAAIAIGLAWATLPGLRGMVTSLWAAPAQTATVTPIATAQATPTAPAATPSANPSQVPAAAPTGTATATATSTVAATPTATPAATATATPTVTWTATAAPSATHTTAPTYTPTTALTPTFAPTPAPQAVAQMASTIFAGPLVGTAELGIVNQGETVEILGRADEVQYGRWLYVRTGADVTGFVYEPRFEHHTDWDALPVQSPANLIPLPTVRQARLSIASGPLRIEHIWPAATCQAEGAWTAYFEVKISGGDGRNYALYWDEERVSYTPKEQEADVAIIQRPGRTSMVVGTVRVESGGQQASQQTSIRKPGECG